MALARNNFYVAIYGTPFSGSFALSRMHADPLRIFQENKHRVNQFVQLISSVTEKDMDDVIKSAIYNLRKVKRAA